MELSEAIKKLKDYKLHGYTKFFLKNNMDRVATKLEIEEMIDTVLKALDNSISKDEVRKKIEEIRSRDLEDCLALHGFQREAQIDVLKELLGE